MKPISKGQLKILLLPLLFTLIGLQSALAVAISSKQSGAWTSTSTWEGGVVPGLQDNVIIKAGHTVTRNTAFTNLGQLYIYGTLVYQGNVSRQFNPGSDIELQGELRVEAGSLYADGLLYGNGTFRQTGGTTTFGRAYVVQNTDIEAGSVTFENTNNGNLYLDYLTLKNATLTIHGTEDLYVKFSMTWGNGGKFNTGALNIQDGCVLNFLSGNNSFYNSGIIRNHGSVVTGAGSIVKNGADGTVYNYGIWKFNPPANSGIGVYDQYFYNFGEVQKLGAGGADFTASGYFEGANTSKIHVIQGGISLVSSTGIMQQGIWQIDAGCSMLVFPYNTSDYLPFAGEKIINNGAVYGNLMLTGVNTISLEGNGKYSKLRIAKIADHVSLGGNQQIEEKLTLDNGLVYLNNYDMNLGDADIEYNSGFSSYLETNGAGGCVEHCPAGTPRFFPVGRNGIGFYSVTMQPGGAGDILKVRTVDSFYGEYVGNTPQCSAQVGLGVVQRTWIVAAQNPGNQLASMTANWSPADEAPEFNLGNCDLGYYGSSNWQSQGFHAGTDGGVFHNQNTYFPLPPSGLFGVFDGQHEYDANLLIPAPQGNSPVCEWSDLQLHAQTSPHADVQWSGPNGYSSDLHDPLIAGIQLSQSGVYSVSASQYGCPAMQAQYPVVVLAEPNPSILGPGQIQQGETATLTAFGGTAYHWSTGDTTQAITVAPAQTTDYRVTVTNPAGCTAEALHTIQVSGATAAHEALLQVQAMKLSPNPNATDVAFLEFEMAAAGKVMWVLSDARGARLHEEALEAGEGQNRISIPLSSLPAGTYQVSLIRENEVKTIRLVRLKVE